VPLRALADGVWIDTAPVRIVGMDLTATMTVLRLTGRELVLHSPVSMTEERRKSIDELGDVTHLVAPNLFHHRWLGEWASAYPTARLHVPRGLPKKRPDLRAAELGTSEPEPAFAGVIELEPIDGFRLNELVLLYRPARVLVVADLVHNVGRPEGAWTKLYTRSMGFYDRVALSRVIRWTAFSDSSAARRSVDRILSRDFERLVVGHGEPVLEQAKDELARALGWLG
jgi:hypothetical protein